MKDPTGKTLSQNNISKEFSTTVKPTVQGQYVLSLYNYGNTSANLGGVFGLAQFINQDNQISFGLFNGGIVGVILVLLGLLTLFVGVIQSILRYFYLASFYQKANYP